MPKLDEVKARVRDDVLKKKAIDVAQQKAAAIAAQLKAGDFNAAAKAAGLEVKTTDLIARGAADRRRRRRAPRSTPRRSRCRPAASATPITTDNGAVVVKVLERKDPTAEEIKAGRAADARRAAQRTPRPLLRLLHEQGARADADRHQPTADLASDG